MVDSARSISTTTPEKTPWPGQFFTDLSISSSISNIPLIQLILLILAKTGLGVLSISSSISNLLIQLYRPVTCAPSGSSKREVPGCVLLPAPLRSSPLCPSSRAPPQPVACHHGVCPLLTLQYSSPAGRVDHGIDLILRALDGVRCPSCTHPVSTARCFSRERSAQSRSPLSALSALS